jgi:hypothetical protein
MDYKFGIHALITRSRERKYVVQLFDPYHVDKKDTSANLYNAF